MKICTCCSNNYRYAYSNEPLIGDGSLNEIEVDELETFKIEDIKIYWNIKENAWKKKVNVFDKIRLRCYTIFNETELVMKWFISLILVV